MKYGVIDVGSNSVRLMISDGKNTIYKKVITTRLAEGMGEGVLQPVAIDRTASAVSFFVEQAKEECVDEIYAYATAAVRQSKNGNVFIDKVKDLCGIDVEIVSGETEAELGVKGALSGFDGGVIDVGGASTEVIVVKDGKIKYSKSLNVGAVKIKDACGQDFDKVKEYIDNKIVEYGSIPNAEFYGIGGTATTIAAIILQLEPYDPNKVDGFKVGIEQLERLTERLFSLSVEERKKLKGLQPARAEVIAGGAALMLSVMKKIGIEHITVSEKDNLEGYLLTKTEKI